MMIHSTSSSNKDSCGDTPLEPVVLNNNTDKNDGTTANTGNSSSSSSGSSSSNNIGSRTSKSRKDDGIHTGNTTTPADGTINNSSILRKRWIPNKLFYSIQYRYRYIQQQFIILLPYIIGIIWHLYGHVHYSILTGDVHNPKRSYIDENSLDPNHFQLYGTYDDITITTNPYGMLSSLCESIQHQEMSTGRHIPCFQYHATTKRRSNSNNHSSNNNNYNNKKQQQQQQQQYHPQLQGYDSSIEIIKVVPLATGMVANQDAIVLVVPSFHHHHHHHHHNSSLGKEKHQQTLHNNLLYEQYQMSILQFIQRLSSPTITPWLSKTIFIVTPLHIVVPSSSTSSTNSTTSTMVPILEATVHSFLNVYLGTPSSSSSSSSQPSSSLQLLLPSEFLGCIIRHVLVIDIDTFELSNVTTTSSITRQSLPPPHVYNRNEIRILSSGRRGVLPNMDLTFLCKFIYERSNMVQQLQQIYYNKNNQKYTMTDVVVHPYQKRILQHIDSIQHYIEHIKDKYQSKIPNHILTSISSFVSMILSWYETFIPLLVYESLLMIGPYPPHTPALERGIDSITIQGYFATTTTTTTTSASTSTNTKYNTVHHKSIILPQQYIMEYVQRLELVIRSLSNLHERLHHSTSLYLLISKDRYVKHEEYLIPNILIILPLLLRAIIYVIDLDEECDVDSSSDDSDKKTSENVENVPDTPIDDRDNNVMKMEATTIPKHNAIVGRDRLHEFSFIAIGQALLITVIWTILACLLIYYYLPILPKDIDTTNMNIFQYIAEKYPMALLYCILGAILESLSRKKHFGTSSFLLCSIDRKHQRCIQFVSCLLATYIHIGIAFGHVSLAFPSALIWTPLLAFPTYFYRRDNIRQSSRFVWLKYGIFLISSPFIYLVPNVFPTYTPYVRYVYIPLHMLFCIQHIMPDSICTT